MSAQFYHIPDDGLPVRAKSSGDLVGNPAGLCVFVFAVRFKPFRMAVHLPYLRLSKSGSMICCGDFAAMRRPSGR